MNQTDESGAKGQKTKICKLAIASSLFAILGPLVVLVNGPATLYPSSFEDNLSVFVFVVSPLISLVLGIVACWKIYKSRGMLRGYGFSVSGIGLALIGTFFTLVIFYILSDPYCRVDEKMICATNLARLGKAMQAYSGRYEQKYPTKDMWCDLLIERANANEKNFVCRGALEHGDKGRCHYAINPNCAPSSPGNVVLLFETKGGWSQFGGPEILTTEHHDGIECIILFNNGRVRAIREKHLGELKWGNKP